MVPLPFSFPIISPIAIILLIAASVLPGRESDTWGSTWPLVGYDYAIDAVYTRGPWLIRFQELEDAERERRITDSMTCLFTES